MARAQAFKHTCALHASAETQPPVAWKLVLHGLWCCTVCGAARSVVLHGLAEPDLEGLQGPSVMCRWLSTDSTS